jgi:uncharacterized protein (DUF4415 family)
MVKVGQKPTKEELKRAMREFREASKYPPVYDEDCPASTPEALKEFAIKAAEMRRSKRKVRSVVALRIMPDCLAKYKALGKGYTGIMADILDYAVENPEFLAKVIHR